MMLVGIKRFVQIDDPFREERDESRHDLTSFRNINSASRISFQGFQLLSRRLTDLPSS